MSCFPELYTHSKNQITTELDLSNCATKATSKIQQVVIYQNLLKRLI